MSRIDIVHGGKLNPSKRIVQLKTVFTDEIKVKIYSIDKAYGYVFFWFTSSLHPCSWAGA